MCHTGKCEYETYPYGYHEECHCKLPKGSACPMELYDEEEYEEEMAYTRDAEL